MKAVISILLCLFLLAGCTVSQEPQTSQADTTAPSGYASGQVQTEMVYCQGNLYVREDAESLPDRPSGYSLLTTVSVSSDTVIPDTDGHAAHVPEGTAIYVGTSDTLHVFVYNESTRTYQLFIRSDQVENWWAGESKPTPP